MFLTFRAGMTEGFCQWEERQMRLLDEQTVGSGMIDTRSFNAENRWQAQIRDRLSEGHR